MHNKIPQKWKYRVAKGGKKDYSSMSLDILGFAHKIYTMVDGLQDEIIWNDLLHLISVFKLVRKLQHPINSYMYSHYTGRDIRVSTSILRRMNRRGFIIEVSRGKHEDIRYKDTKYGESLLLRYSMTMEKFLNGKITDLS